MKMALPVKRVLHINLAEKVAQVKTSTELHKFVGGVGLGVKILNEEIEKDPIIFSVGPLNGFFPYASKTSIVLNSDGVIEDIYMGGSLSTRIKFTGLDSIVISGKATEPLIIEIIDETVNFHAADTDMDTLGLPGKRSTLAWAKKDDNSTATIANETFDTTEKKFLLDSYFSAPEKILERKILLKNVKGLSITGTRTYTPKDPAEYDKLYKMILGKKEEMWIEPNKYPSCSGCPMGCIASRKGEIGGNVIVHSLVACNFAEGIYSDIGVTFSCLNVLGYNYTHEDIQILPKLIDGILRKF